MGYYKLYRQAPQGKAIHGTLYYVLEGGGTRVKTFLVKAASTLENATCAIPALIYKVSVTMSPKFGVLLPLLLQVPGRSGIRIHGGIKPEHSHGCILLNRRGEYKAVVERMLYEQENLEDIRLEIIDFKPGDPVEPKNVVQLDYTKYEKIECKRSLLPAV